MTRSPATTTSKSKTGIFRRLFAAELEQLETALSRDVILTVGHPTAIVMSVASVVVSVAVARWWGPAHAAIGLEDAVLPLVMAGAALATGLVSWFLARTGRMSLARACQFPDFIVWGLLPIVIGWGCTEALGVMIAVAVHALMALRWALYIRGSWVLRGLVLSTWAPLVVLAAPHGWLIAVAIPTSVLFIVANYSSNAHQAEVDRRERETAEQLQHLHRDFEALTKDWMRIRGERDRIHQSGD